MHTFIYVYNLTYNLIYSTVGWMLRLRAQRRCSAASSAATIARPPAARRPRRPRVGWLGAQRMAPRRPSPTHEPIQTAARDAAATAKIEWEEVEMWDGRQVGVGLGGQAFGWTRSLRAVGSRMWVAQLSCENSNAKIICNVQASCGPWLGAQTSRKSNARRSRTLSSKSYGAMHTAQGWKLRASKTTCVTGLHRIIYR